MAARTAEKSLRRSQEVALEFLNRISVENETDEQEDSTVVALHAVEAS